MVIEIEASCLFWYVCYHEDHIFKINWGLNQLSQMQEPSHILAFASHNTAVHICDAHCTSEPCKRTQHTMIRAALPHLLPAVLKATAFGSNRLYSSFDSASTSAVTSSNPPIPSTRPVQCDTPGNLPKYSAHSSRPSRSVKSKAHQPPASTS